MFHPISWPPCDITTTTPIRTMRMRYSVSLAQLGCTPEIRLSSALHALCISVRRWSSVLRSSTGWLAARLLQCGQQVEALEGVWILRGGGAPFAGIRPVFTQTSSATRRRDCQRRDEYHRICWRKERGTVPGCRYFASPESRMWRTGRARSRALPRPEGDLVIRRTDLHRRSEIEILDRDIRRHVFSCLLDYSIRKAVMLRLAVVAVSRLHSKKSNSIATSTQNVKKCVMPHAPFVFQIAGYVPADAFVLSMRICKQRSGIPTVQSTACSQIAASAEFQRSVMSVR